MIQNKSEKNSTENKENNANKVESNLSTLVKKEIMKSEPQSQDNSRAFLSGVIHACGGLRISSSGLALALNMREESHRKYVLPIIKSICAMIEISESSREVKFEGEYVNTLLTECGIMEYDSEDNLSLCLGVPNFCLTGSMLRRSYIKGVFLGGGSVSVGNSYHLEFVVSSEEQADGLLGILQTEEIVSKKLERKDKWIVYSKASGMISDCLALLGAGVAVTQLQSKMILREVNCLANRGLNCITANLDKAIVAAQSQLQAINLICESRGLESLPEKLQAVALVRLSNHEYTIAQIAEELGISKSGVRNRLSKILEISKSIN